MVKKAVWVLMCMVIAASMMMASPAAPATEGIEDEVRHALLMAPHYGVFDIFFFKVEGADVTLLGQVMLPITKVEAEKRVAKIAGIGKISNRIEVLPLSRTDDSIRMRVYRKLFNTADLYRYALGPDPSIHIMVKGGHLTLEGMVSTEEDKKIAAMAVRGIPGVFSVDNHLQWKGNKTEMDSRQSLG